MVRSLEGIKQQNDDAQKKWDDNLTVIEVRKRPLEDDPSIVYSFTDGNYEVSCNKCAGVYRGTDPYETIGRLIVKNPNINWGIIKILRL